MCFVQVRLLDNDDRSVVDWVTVGKHNENFALFYNLSLASSAESHVNYWVETRAINPGGLKSESVREQFAVEVSPPIANGSVTHNTSLQLFSII